MVAEVMKMREEEKNQSSQLKKFFKKRWVYPTVYLFTAAILIGTITWYQSRASNVSTPKVDEKPKVTNVAEKEFNLPGIEVNKSVENISMPVEKESSVEIITTFYDENESDAAQENALIVNGNEYYPSTGIALAGKDGEDFQVHAALSGKVTDVREDSLLGNVIEVEHENDVTTVYQSVKDIQVSAGDQVKQGDVLATAGKSQLANTEHAQLYFEIRKNAQPINPSDYFGQPVTSIEDDSAATSEDESATTSDDESATTNEDESTSGQTDAQDESADDETNAEETREDETNKEE